MDDDEPAVMDPRNGSENGDAPSTSDTPSASDVLSSSATQGLSSSNVSQYASIDLSGTCTSCNDASALKTALFCLMCSKKFHAVCTNVDGDKSGNEVICARTFYSSFMKASSTGVYSKRFGNFVFICDCCMTSYEHNKTATNEDKIDKVETRVNDLSQNVDEIKSMLINLTSRTAENSPIPASNTSESTPTEISYKNALIKPSTRSVLIVENNVSPANSIDEIIIENGIHVNKTVKKGAGSVFVCPSQEDRDNLDKKLNEKFPEIKTRLAPELLPTISVANLSSQYQASDLKDIIFKEHRDIKFFVDQGEKFEILSIRPQKRDNNKFHATIRISNSIRKIIKNLGDRLYIGSNSSSVYDTFHIKRCNKCQKYNHYHSDCKAKDPTCGHCSGKHDSNSCTLKDAPSFQAKCSNCSHRNMESQSHSTFDLTCSSYIAEQEKLRKMISFYQKN